MEEFQSELTAVREDAAKQEDSVDKKYAELLTRMPTRVDETCLLLTYSVHDLRFLLSKNGTVSRNMLKEPAAKALMELINTTGLKPSVQVAEPQKRRRVMGTQAPSWRSGAVALSQEAQTDMSAGE